MSEVQDGYRAVLSFAPLYDGFQRLVGAVAARRRIVLDYLGLRPGQRVLDIGCGTGALLEQMPVDVEYVGFDVSQSYIERARARFGGRALFMCTSLQAADLSSFPPFDLAVAMGVMHHLDDGEARQAFRLGASALHASGRMVAVDPCWTPRQHPVARMLIERDRGQNVRDAASYAHLGSSCFGEVEVSVRTDLLRVPFTHAIVTARRPTPRPIHAGDVEQ